MKNLAIFVPLVKVDEERREVVGVLAEEAVDQADEIMDYVASVPYFKAWSDGFKERTGGASSGNLRAMHGNVAAGKFVDVQFDDDAKQIPVRARVVDDAEWAKCLEGVYTGFSIGGKYVNRTAEKMDGRDVVRYTAQPIEGSLVDSPCMPGATFDVLRAGGATEIRKFQRASLRKSQALQLWTKLQEWQREMSSSVLKGGAEAVTAANTALEGLKRLVAEFALMEGDPPTWTLETLIDAIRGAIDGKFEAEFVAAEEAEAAAAAPVLDANAASPDSTPAATPVPLAQAAKAAKIVDDDDEDEDEDGEDGDKAEVDEEDPDAEAAKAEEDAAAGPNSADDQADEADDSAPAPVDKADDDDADVPADVPAEDADKADDVEEDPDAVDKAEDDEDDDADKADEDDDEGGGDDFAQALRAGLGGVRKYLREVQGTLEKVLQGQADARGHAKSEDVDTLRKALEGATERLAKLEAQPAPVGRPISKTLGNAAEPNAPVGISDLAAAVDALEKAGQLDDAQVAKLRMGLAVQAVPRA